MDKTLRVGVIGAGHFGRYHALKIKDVRRETLIGLFDPDTKRAAEVAKEAGCPVMESVEELLAACDAVVVAAPAEYHFELATEALRAGKHVLVEKPVAATLEQADLLITLAEQSGWCVRSGICCATPQSMKPLQNESPGHFILRPPVSRPSNRVGRMCP